MVMARFTIYIRAERQSSRQIGRHGQVSINGDGEWVLASRLLRRLAPTEVLDFYTVAEAQNFAQHFLWAAAHLGAKNIWSDRKF